MSLSPEQLAKRRSIIGGSEIAAVVKDPATGKGCHPYLSDLDVYRAKTEDFVAVDPDAESTAEMIWGSHVETAICTYLAESQKMKLWEPGTLLHPQHKRVGATPDRIGQYVAADTRIWTCETKHVGPWARKMWGAGDDDRSVPLGYAAQVIYEMGCVRANYPDHNHGDYGLLVAAISGAPPRIFRIPWDAPTFEALAAQAERFWRDCIEKRRPPDDWSLDAKAGEFVAARWAKQNTDLLVPPTPVDVELALRYEELKRKEKEIAAGIEQTGALLRFRIGENEGLGEDAKSTLLTWKQSEEKESPVTDWKAVATEMAQLLDVDWKGVVAGIAANGWLPEEHRAAADALMKQCARDAAQPIVAKHTKMEKSGGGRMLLRKKALAKLLDERGGTVHALELAIPPETLRTVEPQPALIPEVVKSVGVDYASTLPHLATTTIAPPTTTLSPTYVDSVGDVIDRKSGEVLGKDHAMASVLSLVLDATKPIRDAVLAPDAAPCGAEYFDRFVTPPEKKTCASPGKEKYAGRCYKHRPKDP